MAVDDSFKKPGAVPFKWEIRPGVPKLPEHDQPTPSNHHLKPPPATPTPLFRFPSSPWTTQSNGFCFDNPIMVGGPEVVSSSGCFPSRKRDQRKTNKLHVYKSDLDTLSQWSMSTQKSPSPFRDSPFSSSSFSSSYLSSPWMVSDVEWAGFGLF
ncbi:Protein of unknown function DUF688 [Cynara cardunculus var. scolymus]|uniref:Uncharacterized protein n=2 Tax=Cynara cardunculus var. scolymus TaxID=59895 RepID=A0A103VVY4_CYNCS|nr:Protein of unknown function DUF688 [Cynara cardunculus var. scolymus]